MTFTEDKTEDKAVLLAPYSPKPKKADQPPPPTANTQPLPPQPPLTKQNSLFIQKQCFYCRKFYTEIENNFNVQEEHQKPICFYHKSSSQTCCALVPEGGCVKALKHKEDLGFSSVAANFPVHKATLDIMEQTHAIKRLGGGAPNENEDDLPPPTLNDSFIVHRVALTDTLMGISLYYQVKIEDIQRANNLVSHQIYHCKTLLVPRPDRPIVKPAPVPIELTQEQLKAQQQKQIGLFQTQVECSADEARYYMETNNYAIDKAFQEWQKDSQWAAQNDPSKKPKKVQNKHHKNRTCC